MEKLKNIYHYILNIISNKNVRVYEKEKYGL